MGVFRLWSLVKNKDTDLMEDIDLVEVAKGYPGGMRMLIDFYSWELFMKERFWLSLELLYGNHNLMYAGGEYELMDVFIKSLVEVLRGVNIELVFFLDGARGSSYNATRQKMKTWEKRYQDDHQMLIKCLQFLRGQIPSSDVTAKDIPRPTLQEVQNILTLQQAGCTIYQRVSGEADSLIAQHMRDDERAFCVFSNDTDFCIFPGSVLLPDGMFDLHNDLGLGHASITAKKPEKLLCKIVHSSSLIRHFGLPDERSLIELATMAGNDFTGPPLLSIKQYCSSYRGQLAKIAQMVCQHGCAESCPLYGEFMARDSRIRESFEHSRKFYTLQLEDEEAHQQGHVFNILAEGIRQVKLPSTVIAMHRGFYWHRMILEETFPGYPSGEGALAPLRAYIYTLVQSVQQHGVSEYGRTDSCLLTAIQVPKASDSRVPSIALVKRNSFSRNMSLFETIMTHQDYEGFFDGRSVFKLFGLRMGFLVHLLRYFLVLNVDQNLYLSEREFYVLVAWTMSKHNNEAHRRMNIVPSPRCVTVENWFLCLYRTAYSFLGNLLGLSHEFPAPSEVFSGATWIALYTGCAVNDPNPEFRQPRPMGVKQEDLNEANLKVRQVVMDNKHIVEQVVKGFFSFHT